MTTPTVRETPITHGGNMPDNAPHNALRHHVTGAVERGEAEAITAMPADSPYTTIHEREAYKLGCEHARNAASWVIDGNTSQHHIRALLRGMDDGDPAVYDYLPNRPNLSGEWADDLTPASLAAEILDDDPTDLAVDSITRDAYEAGVNATFEVECERILRAALA